MEELKGKKERLKVKTRTSFHRYQKPTTVSHRRLTLELYWSQPVCQAAWGSSLWEIDTLRHHYHPLVSRFVLSLENDLTVRSKTTEVAVKDFSSGSYATIFRAEIGRRVKQVPLAFYKATPSSLFSESDFAGWTFRYKEKDELFTSGVDNKNIDIYEDHNHGSAKRQRIECS